MAYYIGLMSGTSVDSIDAVLVDFQQPSQTTLVATHGHAIPGELRRQLLDLNSTPRITLNDLGELDHQLGHLFADATEALIDQAGATREQIVAIGSHGQTIYHAPNGPRPFTMQIGDPNIIAERCGITTIADLRRRDVAAGGQGAPLVPAFHAAVFYSQEKSRVIVNIGGIANISHLPCNGATGLGFDTGPGNGLLDTWIELHRQTNVDINGEWGRSGKLNQTLLEALLDDSYFHRPPPKSSGRDYFNLAWLKQNLIQLGSAVSPQDVQSTLHHLTAASIAQAITHYARDCDEIYVCGGGAHNAFLLECLQHHCPHTPVATTNSLGIDPDWIEASAFAWLAMRTLNHQSGNLPSVTGAHHPVILGAIYPA